MSQVYGDVEVYPENTTEFSQACPALTDLEVEINLIILEDLSDLGADKALAIAGAVEACEDQWLAGGFEESVAHGICSPCMVVLADSVYN